MKTVLIPLEVPVKILKAIAKEGCFKIPKDFAEKISTLEMQKKLGEAILADWLFLNEEHPEGIGEEYQGIFENVLEQTDD